MNQFLQNKKDRTDFIISIIVISLFAIFILFQTELFKNETPAPIVAKENQSRDPLKIKVAGESKTYVAVDDVEPRRKKDFIENDKTYRQVQNANRIASRPKKDVPQAALSLEEFEVQTPAISETKVIPSGIIKTQDSKDDYLLGSKSDQINKGTEPAVIQKVEKPIVEKPKTIEQPKVVQPKVAKPKPIDPKIVEDCVILIGAFKESNNKTRLIKNLEAENYKLFKKPFRGLTRIGVFVRCDKQVLDKTLKVIRKNYASDAFVLKVEK